MNFEMENLVCFLLRQNLCNILAAS